MEALVLSQNQYFEDFQVIRDLYLPQAEYNASPYWLCEYPFIKREAFQRISADVFYSRTRGGGRNTASWD